MKNLKTLFILFLFLSGISSARSGQKFADLGDFKLESGETVKDCKIGYRTYGTLNEDKSNVIIYPTWFDGTSEQIGNSLIGPDKVIDSTVYYVIAIDALGNGISTSPSNSQLQPGYKFPKFTMTDIVNAEYEMLTRVLDIKHLYGAIGGSMGSMQVLELISAYPDFVDRAIPYVCTPWPSSYDQYFWSIGLKIIDNGFKYNVPDKETCQLLNMLIVFLAYTPDYIDSTISRDKIAARMESYNNKELSKTLPPVNWAYQARAMLGHDISKHYDYSKEKTAAAIKSRLLMIVGKNDHLLNPHPALELAKLMNIQPMVLDNKCGHIIFSCAFDECRSRIRQFLSEK